jgi:polar amino acid transport system ATP-binding protein
MCILQVNNLVKSFDDLQVLKDISLSVDNGEIISIIGSSGSGKSTLLRCLNRLESVDGGKIIIDGDMMVSTEDGKVKYAKKQVLKKIRMKTGLVFQNFNLFPHYNVLRSIMEAPICVAGVAKEEAEKTAYELLEQLGLKDKAESYPHQLSGGQSQRVSIARALALKPKILFFDEPTSALDPELSGEEYDYDYCNS